MVNTSPWSSSEPKGNEAAYKLKIHGNLLVQDQIPSSTCQAGIGMVRTSPWSSWAAPTGKEATHFLQTHGISLAQDPRFHQVHAKQVQTWSVLCIGHAELHQQGKRLLTRCRSIEFHWSKIKVCSRFHQLHARQMQKWSVLALSWIHRKPIFKINMSV